LADGNLAVNTGHDGEMEGPRLVGAKIAEWHRRNRVVHTIGNLEI
jgi:hypothetical protein